MKEMNHCERVFCVLECRQPDRVPLFELVIDEGVMQGILPGCDYFEFVDKMGLDVVGLNRSSWRRDNVEYVDEEKGLFKDNWGVIRAFGPESSPYPIEGPIKEPDDLKTYTPPDADHPDALGALPAVVKRYKGEKPIIWIGRDAFFNPAHLRGMEQFLMDMILNPQLVHDLVEVCQSYDLKLTERAVQAGVDVVVFGDDYADKNGPMMSPRHFQEFILPGLEKAVGVAKDAGAYTIKHTDGNIWPIFDMIVDSGVDAIHPLEPVAGMDIGEVKKRYGDRICLVGNIDCGDVLSRFSVERVREEVKKCLAAAAPGGGFMLSSSNSIHSSVKPENYRAMIECLQEYGKYPVQL